MMLENYDSRVSVLYIQVPLEGCHSNWNKILALLHNVNQLSELQGVFSHYKSCIDEVQ